MKREISYFTELEKWYKKTPGSGFKKYILEEIHNLRDYSQGNNVLYLGPSEFSKKFQFKSHLSFIFFDDFNLSNHIKNQQKMPFGDNSHDLIIIVHTLDYVQNPYELVREIDRIATDGAKIILIGFNLIVGINKLYLLTPQLISITSVSAICSGNNVLNAISKKESAQNDPPKRNFQQLPIHEY